jgi:arsenate reductase (thioredoxin)
MSEAETPRPVQPRPVITQPPQRVLFMCVGNAARSQMAEGFARKMAPEGVEVWSAGVKPKVVNPLAVEVMKEAGIDIGGQTSKHLDDVPWQGADTIITLCAENAELCPVVPAEVRTMHWPLDDPTAAPKNEALAAFRQARDEIKWRVASLWPVR